MLFSFLQYRCLFSYLLMISVIFFLIIIACCGGVLFLLIKFSDLITKEAMNIYLSLLSIISMGSLCIFAGAFLWTITIHSFVSEEEYLYGYHWEIEQCSSIAQVSMKESWRSYVLNADDPLIFSCVEKAKTDLLLKREIQKKECFIIFWTGIFLSLIVYILSFPALLKREKYTT